MNLARKLLLFDRKASFLYSVVMLRGFGVGKLKEKATHLIVIYSYFNKLKRN